MNNKIYIGIDPGKAGFITVFDGITPVFLSMPYHKVPTGEKTKAGKDKVKTAFHEEGFKQLLEDLKHLTEGKEIYAGIEEVIGRQGWSAQNNFNFGYVAGMQKMLMIMLGAKITMIRPQKWQSTMYGNVERIKKPSSTGKTMVNDTKAMSSKVAHMLAPHIDFRKTPKSKNIDDNKTDSFLICMYVYGKEKD